MTIDITKPLELSDGTPILEVTGLINETIMVRWNEGERTFLMDGKPKFEDVDRNFAPALNGRTLRNVKERTMRTSDECLQRMEALLRRISDSSYWKGEYFDEARSIVNELDKANGPQTDDEWADKLCEEWAACPYPFVGHINVGSLALQTLCKTAIAKGRELERLDKGWIKGDIARTYDAKGNLCHD